MVIGRKVTDPQTKPSQWTASEREMWASTTSQVAGGDVEAWDDNIDGVVLWLESDTF